jgi:hypothetical protein
MMFACNVFTSPNDCTYKFIANQLYTVKDADSNATKRFLLASAINKVKNYLKGWGGEASAGLQTPSNTLSAANTRAVTANTAEVNALISVSDSDI